MGLSGLVGSGAVKGLEDIITEQLMQAKFAEEQRQAQAQEAIQRQRVDQDAQRIAQEDAQHADMMGLNTRAADRADTDRRDRANRAGVADMMAQREMMDAQEAQAAQKSGLQSVSEDETLPESLRKVAGVTLRTGGAMKVGAGDFADPEAARKAALGDFEAKQQIIAKYRPAPAERPTGPGGMNPGQLTTAKQFQDDYARDSKTYLAVRNAYQQVASAAKSPDAAGDLSLIFGYMKMLDPNSVVRETEFANAQNAAGVPDQIRNLYNRAISGERLNPAQRQQFVGQAHRLMTNAHQNQTKVRGTYGSRAQKFGIDPTMVLDEEDPLDPAPGAASDGGTVKMMAPNGQIKDVPASQVEAYTAKGAKVVG